MLVCMPQKYVTQYKITLHAAAAKSLQSCPTLCDPIDGSPPGSPILGILQARTLEWVAISFSNAWKWSESEVAQSCPTLSDPMDCSLPGSSVHGLFQARVLEWVAIALSHEAARTPLSCACLCTWWEVSLRSEYQTARLFSCRTGALYI